MNHAVRLAVALVSVLPALAPTNAGAEPASVTLEFIMPARYGSAGIAEDGSIIGVERIDETRGAVTRFVDGAGYERLYENDLDHLGRAWIASSGHVSFAVTEGPIDLNFRHAPGGPFELVVAGEYTSVYGMNDRGAVWGSAVRPYGYEGFVYDGTLRFLESPVGENSSVGAINDVGSAALNFSSFFVDRRVGTVRVNSDGSWVELGSFGGGYTNARAMNNHGDVVGFSTDATGRTFSFLYSDDAGLTALPLFEYASTTDINDSRWIIGDWLDEDAGRFMPFLWTPEAGVLRLNDLLPEALDAQLYDATGINNAGQIVGTGHINGQFGVYRLTVHTLPTPGALAMFAVGIVFAVRRRR